MFYLLLDVVITDIKAIFGAEQKASSMLSKILLCNFAATTWQDVKAAFEKYAAFLANESVEEQFVLWKQNLVQSEDPGNLQTKCSVFSALDICDNITFSNIYTL